MNTETIGNLVISGSGRATGGMYHEVKVNGSGKITGDLNCEEFKTNGSSEVIGNIQAKLTKVNGSSIIRGNVQTDDIKISGSAEIVGNVSAKTIKVNGSADINGQMIGEQIDIHGSASIRNDCEAEQFTAKGGFEIGGLLNAGTIEIVLYGGCHAKEIGGEHISVKAGGMAFGLRKILRSLFQSALSLKTDTIEGDDIYLEYTTAKVVRGTNVSIGPGCNIDLVEYKHELEQAKNSKIGDSKKL